MGETFLFRCEACAYEAEVSGGADRGFLVATQTVACAKCKVLVDVVTSEDPGNPEARKVPLRCPRSRTVVHLVKKWMAGGPCPRCGEKMSNTGELLVMWD